MVGGVAALGTGVVLGRRSRRVARRLRDGRRGGRSTSSSSPTGLRTPWPTPSPPCGAGYPVLVVDNSSSSATAAVVTAAGRPLRRRRRQPRVRGGGEPGAVAPGRPRARRAVAQPRRPHRRRRRWPACTTSSSPTPSWPAWRRSSTSRDRTTPAGRAGRGTPRREPGRRPWASVADACESARYFLGGAVLLLRRAALAEVGGFDERFFLYSEDEDWQRRALARGWRVRLCPEVSAEHAAGGTDSDGTRHQLRLHCAIERYVRKWYGPVGWTAYRAGTAVRAGPPSRDSERGGRRAATAPPGPALPDRPRPRRAAGRGRPGNLSGAPGGERGAVVSRPGAEVGPQAEVELGDEADQLRHVGGVEVDQASPGVGRRGPPWARRVGLGGADASRTAGSRRRGPRSGTCGPARRRDRPRTARTAARAPAPRRRPRPSGAARRRRSRAPPTRPPPSRCATRGRRAVGEPRYEALDRVADDDEQARLGGGLVEQRRHPGLVDVVGRPLPRLLALGPGEPPVVGLDLVGAEGQGGVSDRSSGAPCGRRRGVTRRGARR